MPASSRSEQVWQPPDGRPRVHCVGLATLDLVFRTATLPNGPGKSFASALSEIGGGPASSAAVCVARLGGQASFAGRIGEDGAGARVADELRREGVDIRWLRRFSGVQTSVSAIGVDGHGERAILAYSDPSMPMDAQWLTPELEPGVVLADLSWPAGALTMLRQASGRGWPAVLDADRFRHPVDRVSEVVAAASDVIFSRSGLAQWSGREDLFEGLKSVDGHHRLLAVTDGASGVFWIESGTLRCQRPPQIQASDTTGAGDAFHGAYSLALARGETVLGALRFATGVAAAKCTLPGGRAGLPDPARLADFLHRNPLPDPQTLARA